MEHIKILLALVGMVTIMYHAVIIILHVHYKLSMYINRTLLKPPMTVKVGVPINLKRK